MYHPLTPAQGSVQPCLPTPKAAIRSSGCTAVYLDASQNALDFYLRRGYLRAGLPHADGAYPLRKDLTAVEP